MSQQYKPGQQQSSDPSKQYQQGQGQQGQGQQGQQYGQQGQQYGQQGQYGQHDPMQSKSHQEYGSSDPMKSKGLGSESGQSQQQPFQSQQKQGQSK